MTLSLLHSGLEESLVPVGEDEHSCGWTRGCVFIDVAIKENVSVGFPEG